MSGRQAPFAPLRFREETFTPAETAVVTGLSTTMQRDWRHLGHLRSHGAGRAYFKPRELAAIRVMLSLRRLGLSLEDARAAAEATAIGVLVMTLDHEEALGCEGTPEQRAVYIAALEPGYDNTLGALGGLAVPDPPRFIMLQDGVVRFVPELNSSEVADDSETGGYVNLQATARLLTESLPHPLFTLLPLS